MTTRRIKGVWWVDFRFEQMRIRKRSPVDTKRGADEYERLLRQRLLQGLPLDGSDGKETKRFDEFANQWLETYPRVAGNRPSEVRGKEICLRVHLLPALGSLRLDEITSKRIEGFAASKLDQGLSRKSVHNILTVLARCLKSAVEWGELERVPVFRKPKTVLPEIDWLRSQESAALLEAARDQEDYLRLLFALDTGARAGEQLGLEWGDIDFHNRKVVFRRSCSRGEVGPTKSGKTRDVPMTERLRTALMKHKHLRSALVFCREDGTVLSLDQLHETLWRTCRRAGLRRLRWRDLRHTFASQLVSLGVPLRQVQAWLGHSSLNMVLRYSHLEPGQNAALIRVLEQPTFGHHLGTTQSLGGM